MYILSLNSIDVKTAFKECLYSNMFYLHVPFSDQKFLNQNSYLCSKEYNLAQREVLPLSHLGVDLSEEYLCLPGGLGPQTNK